MKRMNPGYGGSSESSATGSSTKMRSSKGGLKEKFKAAMERANAGRQAKLTAKSEVAADQGKYKKAAKLETRSLKSALRSENRQQRQDLKTSKKNAMAMGKMLDKGNRMMGKQNYSSEFTDQARPTYPIAGGASMEKMPRLKSKLTKSRG